MLSPPVPLPAVKSPPWHMKPGMTRWKEEPLYHSGLPLLPTPFSPVHSALQLSCWTAKGVRGKGLRAAAAGKREEGRTQIKKKRRRRARLKFSAVRGTTELYSSITMRPAGAPPMVKSK